MTPRYDFFAKMLSETSSRIEIIFVVIALALLGYKALDWWPPKWGAKARPVYGVIFVLFYIGVMWYGFAQRSLP